MCSNSGHIAKAGSTLVQQIVIIKNVYVRLVRFSKRITYKCLIICEVHVYVAIYYLDRVCWLPLVLLKEQVGLDVVHHSGVLARAHVLGVLLGVLQVPEPRFQAVRAPALHRH